MTSITLNKGWLITVIIIFLTCMVLFGVWVKEKSFYVKELKESYRLSDSLRTDANEKSVRTKFIIDSLNSEYVKLKDRLTISEYVVQNLNKELSILERERRETNEEISNYPDSVIIRIFEELYPRK